MDMDCIRACTWNVISCIQNLCFGSGAVPPLAYWCATESFPDKAKVPDSKSTVEIRWNVFYKVFLYISTDLNSPKTGPAYQFRKIKWKGPLDLNVFMLV
jgi:hypothetical protein